MYTRDAVTCSELPPSTLPTTINRINDPLESVYAHNPTGPGLRENCTAVLDSRFRNTCFFDRTDDFK